MLEGCEEHERAHLSTTAGTVVPPTKGVQLDTLFDRNKEEQEMIEDHQIRSLMLLYELENALSSMYVVFSHAYPEHNVLWKRLIAEEQVHAESVRKLYGLTYQGKVLFDEGTIKHAGIQSIIDHIKNISDSARQRKFSEVQVISHSLDIERSLIERKLFDLFKVSSEFSDLLRILRQGSESHGALVARELAKVTNKPNPTTKQHERSGT